jgi:hypothetical protein
MAIYRPLELHRSPRELVTQIYLRKEAVHVVPRDGSILWNTQYNVVCPQEFLSRINHYANWSDALVSPVSI